MAAAAIKSGTGTIVENLWIATTGLTETGSGSITTRLNQGLNAAQSAVSSDSANSTETPMAVRDSFTTQDLSGDRMVVIHFVNAVYAILDIYQTVANAGIEIRLHSGATPNVNYRSFIVGGRNMLPIAARESYIAVVINADQTTTYNGDTGTFDSSDVQHIEILWVRDTAVKTSLPTIFLIQRQFFLDPYLLIGGTTPDAAATFQDLLDYEPNGGASGNIATDGLARLFEEQGDQVFVKAPIGIGDGGTNTVRFDDSGKILEFPIQAGVVTNNENMHILENDLGLEVNLGASDTVDLRNYSFGGETKYYLKVIGNTSGRCTFTSCQIKKTGTFEFKAGAEFIDSIITNCDEMILN